MRKSSTIDDLSVLRSEHGQPKSDITLSGNAAFLTQYAKRGFTLSAERPAVQVEFDLFYKEIYYAGIWASNANFGSAPSGQDLASVELDYYAGVAPTVGKWSFNILVVYTSYPGAFDPGGEFSFVEIRTGVSRSLFDDKLKLTLYSYWAPEFFGEQMKSSNSVPCGPSTRLFHTETQRRTRPSMGRSEPGRLRLYLLECRLDARLQCKSAARARDSLSG